MTALVRVARRRTSHWVGLALVAVLAVTLTSVPDSVSASPDPSTDHTRLPRACALPADLIPQRPVRCHLNAFRADRPTIVIWGDSHAWMMVPAFEKLTQRTNVNLVGFFMGSCPPMKPVGLSKRDLRDLPCLRSNQRAVQFVAKLARGDQKLKVLLAGSWDAYETALRRKRQGLDQGYGGPAAPYAKTMTPALFRWLGKKRIDVDVDGQVATIPYGTTCSRGMVPWSCTVPRRQALPREKATLRAVRRNVRHLAGSPRLIDVNRGLCDARTCYPRIAGANTWYDYRHLSASMARKLSPYFAETVNDVLRGRP